MKINISIEGVDPETLKILSKLLLVGTDAPKAKAVSTKHKKSGHPKIYDIPQFKVGSPEFQRAYRLCRKYNVTSYLEALRLDGQLKVEPEPPKYDAGAPHWKEIIKNTVNPPHKPIRSDTS